MKMRTIALGLLIATVITGSSLYTLNSNQPQEEEVILPSSKVANSTQIVSPSSIHWEHQKISSDKK
jgi:hypothetical protein